VPLRNQDERHHEKGPKTLTAFAAKGKGGRSIARPPGPIAIISTPTHATAATARSPIKRGANSAGYRGHYALRGYGATVMIRVQSKDRADRLHWPPRAVTLRVLDVHGQEIHSKVEDDSRTWRLRGAHQSRKLDPERSRHLGDLYTIIRQMRIRKRGNLRYPIRLN
jgi:hypothetical protein